MLFVHKNHAATSRWFSIFFFSCCCCGCPNAITYHKMREWASEPGRWSPMWRRCVYIWAIFFNCKEQGGSGRLYGNIRTNDPQPIDVHNRPYCDCAIFSDNINWLENVQPMAICSSRPARLPFFVLFLQFPIRMQFQNRNGKKWAGWLCAACWAGDDDAIYCVFGLQFFYYTSIDVINQYG